MWHSNKCTICIDVFLLLPLGNGHYLYMYVSAMSAVKTARLIRIEYPLAEQMCFTFWYYMYENEPNRGMLNVTWDSIVLWTNSKTTNGRWSFAAININANDNKTHPCDWRDTEPRQLSILNFSRWRFHDNRIMFRYL